MLELVIQQFLEYKQREDVFKKARAKADALGKPLLNAGCGLLYTYAIEKSDVNYDVEQREVPNFQLGCVEDMYMFRDKQFGAVYCAHVLEHVENVNKALSELKRVADYQYIITPSPFFLVTWLHPYHRRVFIGQHILELPPKLNLIPKLQ